MSDSKMTFKPLLSSTTTRPPSESRQYTSAQAINGILTRNFHSTTLLLAGAIVQGTLVLLIPRIWILLPSIIALLIRSLDTLAITYRFRPNHYLQGSFQQKWTAILPDKDGNYSPSSGPADQKIAVLMLFARINHPLGIFAPHVADLDRHGEGMYEELDTKDPSLTGFLGQSTWQNESPRHGGQGTMSISYWRSIEDIHAYANSPLHIAAMQWWSSASRADPHAMRALGIAHEIYEAPAHRWEAVALNFQPTMLGATTFLRRGDTLVGGVVEDRWVNPIVEASGRLRTSSGRLGWGTVGTSRSEREVPEDDDGYGEGVAGEKGAQN